MRRHLYTYLIILFALLSGPDAAAQRGAYSRASKTPRGFYVLNDQLKEVLPLATISGVSSTIFNSLKGKTFYRAAYLITVSDFSPVWPDLKALRDFAEEGNQVMVAASSINETAEDFFHITMGAQSGVMPNDSIRLSEAATSAVTYYHSRVIGRTPSIQFEDSSRTKVLGVNSDGRPNFIKIKYGKGAVYFHSVPNAFTNYFLLDRKNYKYTQAVLSYLPNNTGELLWKSGRTGSSGYDGERAGEFGFMSFIMGDANLRSAFFLMLLAVALLIVFGFKRRQRIIPEVQPVTNTTLEFAQTLGDLYFNHRSNGAIAAKKILYWQEYVRNTYQIPTHNMGQDFWQLLLRKSGAGPDLLRQLELQIVRARNNPQLKDRDLVALNNCIDQFYKT